MRGVLVGAQHRAAEAAALHLQQLVNQHIAQRADVARKAAPAKDDGLAEGAAVAEFGEVQGNARQGLEVDRIGVRVVS